VKRKWGCDVCMCVVAPLLDQERRAKKGALHFPSLIFSVPLFASRSLSSLLVASLRWGRPQQRPLGDIMEWVKGYANDWTTVDGSALPMSAVVRTVLLGV
jgi:hypothetical protein